MPDITFEVDDDALRDGINRAHDAADDLAARLAAATPEPEWVRVRDSSGHEITVRADLPDGHPRGIKPGMTVLDKPAVRLGEPLAPKYRTALGEPLPGSKVARKRARESAQSQTATPEPVPAAELTQPEANTTDGHVADTPMED